MEDRFESAVSWHGLLELNNWKGFVLTDTPQAPPSNSARLIAAQVAQIFLFAAGIVLMVFTADAVVGRFFPLDLNGKQNLNRSVRTVRTYATHSTRTNSDGFRERELPLEPSDDERRVLFIGDSFTFGQFVEGEDSFVRRAEPSMRRAEPDENWVFYNLSLGDTSPREYLRILEVFGERIGPEIVIVCYNQGSDALIDSGRPAAIQYRPRWFDNVANANPSNLRRYLHTKFVVDKARRETRSAEAQIDPEVWLEEKRVSSDPETRAWANRVDIEILKLFKQMGPINRSTPVGSLKTPDILYERIKRDRQTIAAPYARETMANLKVTSDDLGAELWVLFLPYWDVDPRTWVNLNRMGYTTRPALQHNRRFQNTHAHYAKELGIRVLDSTPLIAASEDYCFYDIDPHINPIGHEIVAEMISDALLGNGDAPQAAIDSQYTTVQRWEFDNDGGWKGASGSTRLQFGESTMVVDRARDDYGIFHLDAGLNTSEINRLRIRMRSNHGRVGFLWWGDASDGRNVLNQIQSETRNGYFPVLSDGAFHTYEIALDHIGVDWSGEWNTLFLKPIVTFSWEEIEEALELAIDFIELGFESPSTIPPNVWESVEQAQGL